MVLKRFAPFRTDRNFAGVRTERDALPLVRNASELKLCASCHAIQQMTQRKVSH